jgi:hypothetical protein
MVQRMLWSRSALFWDLTQRRSVILRRHTSPILRDQVVPGPMGCPETSMHNYQSTLCKIPEEHRSHLLHGGSLKSSNVIIDRFLTNTKAKLFFLCAYLEPDNIANCKLSEFNILERILCTATAISFNRPARGRNFFLRHCVQAPSGTHPGFHPLDIDFFKSTSNTTDAWGCCLPSGAEGKNSWTYSSDSPLVSSFTFF